MPAGNIPYGRCRVMRLQQMVRDVVLSHCSRLTEQRVGLRDTAAHLERTAPVENRQRITGVRQIFLVVALVRLRQVSTRKRVKASLAEAIRPVTLVDIGIGTRRTQKAKRQNRQ